MHIDLRLRYPRTYVLRIHPEKQIAAFTKFFPALDAGEVVRALPYAISGAAEECFIVPDDKLIAPSLAEATELILSRLGIDPKKIPLEELKRSERTENALRSLKKGHFWIIPAQFGFCHRGKASSETRNNYAENEFGLDAYLVAACLFTHRGRLTGGGDELGIDCPGNEDVNGFGSLRVPCFNSFEGMVRCLMNRVTEPNPRYGSATGFVLKL